MTNAANSPRWCARTGGFIGSGFLMLAYAINTAAPVPDEFIENAATRLACGGAAYFAAGFLLGMRKDGARKSLTNLFAGAAIPPALSVVVPPLATATLNIL